MLAIRKFPVRLCVAIISALAAPILALILVVMVHAWWNGIADERQIQAFAEHAGRFVGPIGGILCAFAATRWALGRGRSVAWGTALAIGVAVAAGDVLVGLALGAPMTSLDALSNLSRVCAALVAVRGGEVG